MKIYAKQVSAEYQESPLFIEGCFPDNIILTGNRDYNSHTTPEFDQIKDHFEDMAGTWENDRFFFQWNGAGYDKITKKPDYTLQELLTDYGFTRPDGKPWTTKQRHEWRLLMEREELGDDGIIKALQLLTGKAWKAFTIRGCCQSDWQSGFCPVDEWSREALKAFEIEYFNTGTEYIAFNSTLKTYTTNPAEVKRGQVLTLACNHFEHVAREIFFNGYDYTDDLTAPAEGEEVPVF